MCFIKVGDLAKYNKKPKTRKLTSKEKVKVARQIFKAIGLDKTIVMNNKYTKYQQIKMVKCKKANILVRKVKSSQAELRNYK